MQEIICKRCSTTHCMKSGYIHYNQRYKCNNCGYNFKICDNCGKIKPEAKALALLLYGSGKSSYGMITRLLNVSRSTVSYWIRTMGSKLPESVIDTDIDVVSIDEMWHFLTKKTKKMVVAGSGLP